MESRYRRMMGQEGWKRGHIEVEGDSLNQVVATWPKPATHSLNLIHVQIMHTVYAEGHVNRIEVNHIFLNKSKKMELLLFMK